MSVVPIKLKNLSNRESDTIGTGVFLDSSTLVVHPLKSVEIAKGQPLKDLSKFSPKLRILQVGDLSLLIETSLQIEGGYVAEASTPEFDAIGQGETEEEALQDIRHAIEILKEASARNTSE